MIKLRPISICFRHAAASIIYYMCFESALNAVHLVPENLWKEPDKSDFDETSADRKEHENASIFQYMLVYNENACGNVSENRTERKLENIFSALVHVRAKSKRCLRTEIKC